MQLNQIHRYQRHQREQKSITSPIPFHQLSLPLSVFVAFSSSFNLPALQFAASSSSSLSFKCHSTFPSYFNMLLLIKNQVLSQSKKDALPPHFFPWRAQMQIPPFPAFAVHVSINSTRLFDWQQLACQSRGKSERRGLGSKKWKRDMRRREEWGIEKDISNSKRHAVFPWQLGFHGNGLAKDAISVKKKYLLTLYCTVCTQI